MNIILVVIMVVLMVVGLPFWVVTFLRNPYGAMRTNKPMQAVGGALNEIDKIFARPSVEHKIEMEEKVHRSDDDIGGE